LPDAFADAVISNGVLNLTLDKVVTLREWARVLKPGGRLRAGDIVVARTVPQSAVDVEIVSTYDIFEGVPDPSSALQFGTRGISFRARKP
jgi:ubiquinone/menaquinone biosynthesis C-methylase UbiE